MSVAIRVFVGLVRAEGMGVVPAPDRGVARVHDHPQGVEVVGVDVMHLDRTGGSGFRDYRNRNVAQPHGCRNQPVIGWGGCDFIVAAFADCAGIISIILG